MRLQHNSLPFLPLASRSTTLWLGHAHKSKFWTRKWPTSLGFSIFGFFFRLSFFSFSCLFAAVIDLLLGLLAVKKTSKQESSRQAIFSMEQPGVVAGNFAPSFSLNFLSIFVHISGSIWPITLIWASSERSYPPAEVEYRWCQFWSKVMTSEVEERPRFVTAGYGRHRSQWVKTHAIRQWIFCWNLTLAKNVGPEKIWNSNFQTEQLSTFCILQLQQWNEELNTKTHYKLDYNWKTDLIFSSNFTLWQ